MTYIKLPVYLYIGLTKEKRCLNVAKTNSNSAFSAIFVSETGKIYLNFIALTFKFKTHIFSANEDARVLKRAEHGPLIDKVSINLNTDIKFYLMSLNGWWKLKSARKRLTRNTRYKNPLNDVFIWISSYLSQFEKKKAIWCQIMTRNVETDGQGDGGTISNYFTEFPKIYLFIYSHNVCFILCFLHMTLYSYLCVCVRVYLN